MKPLKINDNSTYLSSTDFSKSAHDSELVKKIVNNPLEELESSEGIFVFPDIVNDAEGISRDKKILEKGTGDNYQTHNVMGFLGLGEERLFITSRFSGSDKSDFQEGDMYFPFYMLEKALQLPAPMSSSRGYGEDGQISYFFASLFPYFLKRAVRKGIFKQYIRREYNDSNVKGTIDVARHIRQNTPFMGRIAYSQREFSYDNFLTELVRHTIEFIKGRYGGDLLSKVKNEVRQFVDVTPRYRFCDRQKIIRENQKHRIHHAYFHEYLDLQRLCLLILGQKKFQSNASSQQMWGILFDGAWLWEAYVATLLEDDFRHPNNKTKEGREYLFYNEVKPNITYSKKKSKDEGPEWSEDENPLKDKIGSIYPDFMSKDKDSRSIADAKYKPIENIKGKDYWQILAYMFRFDAKRGYFIYPAAEETLKKPSENVVWQRLQMYKGTIYEGYEPQSPEIIVYKLGLKIPKAESENYEGFKDIIEKSEEKLRNKLEEFGAVKKK